MSEIEHIINNYNIDSRYLELLNINKILNEYKISKNNIDKQNIFNDLINILEEYQDYKNSYNKWKYYKYNNDNC
tara:strand:- start:966 stop:1187 length:222 start_codon:yes stop_codon:yes gene_type:complete